MKDNSDVLEARHGTLANTNTSSKKKTKSYSWLRQQKSRAELETMRTWRCPTTVMTANGEGLTREEPTVYVKE